MHLDNCSPPKNNRRVRRQLHGTVAVSPPPAAPNNFKYYIDMVPFLVFGTTFLMVILESIHGYLVWDLEKTMGSDEELIIEFPIDCSTHITWILIVYDIKKIIDNFRFIYSFILLTRLFLKKYKAKKVL